MEEETQANTEVAVMEVAQSFEAHNGKKEEEETSLDGEFIKVEKETLDMKGNSDASEAKSVESEVRSSNKVKELEIELDKVTKALKDSESENVELKGQLSSAKDKAEQMAEGEDRLNMQIKNLQEDLEILLSRHKEHSGIKEAFEHLNSELESSKKKMEELEQELQSSVSDSRKFEELHLQSASHLESETKRAEELERLVEAAKLSAKEAEDQLASLHEELKGLRGKIVENEAIEASLKSTTMELSRKDSLIDEMYKEVDLVKNSERHLKENMLALESLLASTQNDLQLKVSELEEIQLKLGEEVSAKESVEASFKSQELKEQDELAKVAAEKEGLEAVVAELTNNLEQMKSTCAELETKLKLSKEEFGKADVFSAELTIKNAELGLKLKAFEELLSESKSSEASALQKNLEFEDLIQAANSAAETARLQLQDNESKLEAVELKNNELEEQLTLFESKHGDTDRDLKEHREKLSELHLKLKDLETEKDQMKAYEDLLVEAASKAAALSEELDRSSTKGAYLESLNEELKKMMDEAENRAAQSLSENELLAETNSQLKSKVDELQRLFDTATAEKEEAARQLASHVSTLAELTNQHALSSELQSGTEARILQVETLLQETIEKLTHKELETKELSERFSSSEEKIKVHEIKVRESVEIAETRKFELDQTHVKVQEQQKHIESLEAKLEQLETHLGALAEANMKLNEELAVSESKLNDLHSKLSAALADKDDAVQNMNSSMKKVEDLTQGLASERQRLQTEILSIMEQKEHLIKTNMIAQNELQTLITQLEGQLKEHQERNGALKADFENLKLEAAQNSALQARVKELKEKLLVTEADLRKEVESVQASAAATEVDLTSRLGQHLQKTKEDDTIREKLLQLQHELASAQSTITELKEENNKLVSAQGSGVKQSSEEFEAKCQQVVHLEKHVKELEQKLNAESMISKEPGDGAEVRSRDIGSNLSSPTKRKNKKSGPSSSTKTPSASSETHTKTIEAPYSLNNLKLVLGVALVSIIIGLILGKRC